MYSNNGVVDNRSMTNVHVIDNRSLWSIKGTLQALVLLHMVCKQIITCDHIQKFVDTHAFHKCMVMGSQLVHSP